MKNLLSSDDQIYDLINLELDRQSNTLEMIASENFTSKAVLESVGSILTNKYYTFPWKRFFCGVKRVKCQCYHAFRVTIHQWKK